MNDIFDEIERVGRSGSKGMGKRLKSESVKDALVAASRKGRRRRAVAQGAMVVAAIGVLVTGVSLLPTGEKDSVLPGSTPWDGSMTDARVGEVEPLPDLSGGPDASYPLACWDVYDPPTEPGLTIRDTSVKDLGIRVESSIAVGNKADVEPGGIVTVTSDDGAGVNVDVSWVGDRPLAVMGYLALVGSDGTLHALGTPGPFFTDGGRLKSPFGPAIYDPMADRSEVTIGFLAEAYYCLTDRHPDDLMYPSTYEDFAEFDGDYSVVTVIQVSDEAGVPLATFVDSLEISGTTFRYQEAPEKWVNLDQEWEDAIATNWGILEEDGHPVAETFWGIGWRPVEATCEEIAQTWATSGGALLVVPGTQAAPHLPAVVSKSDLESGPIMTDDRGGHVEAYPWYGGSGTYLVLRSVDPDAGEPIVIGGALVPASAEDDRVVFEAGDSPYYLQCGAADALAAIRPGTYEAAFVLREVSPYGIHVSDWPPRIEGYGFPREWWEYLGEITITE